MARTSAVGYISAARQLGGSGNPSGLAVPRDHAASTNDWLIANPKGKFFRFLSAPKGSAEFTMNRYREGGGGRDVTLNLKEGIRHNVEFPMFARPVPAGFIFQAVSGPANWGSSAMYTSAGVGGGVMSNGLFQVPKIHASTPCNTTVKTPFRPNADIDLKWRLYVNSITAATAADWMVIGLGGNMEFAKVTSATADYIIFNAPLLYAHAKGERVYTVTKCGSLASAYTTGNTLALTAGHSFTTGSGTDALAIVGVGADATKGGIEWGQAEQVLFTTVSSNDVTVATPAHDHSAGAWVFEVDVANANWCHSFEPVASLTGSIDYFSVERSAAGGIVELVQDCKVGTCELSGESPGPLRLNPSFVGRYGTIIANPMTEDYANQDAVLNLPFRMPNGGFLFEFGTKTGISTKIRQFTAGFTNTVADDVFTDQISRDEILDLARETQISCQFYFDTKDEYYQVVYGSDTAGATPTTSATGGQAVLNFDIGGTRLLNVYYPQVVWENFPPEVDPEPKPIIVEATGAPLKKGVQPIYVVVVQNEDTLHY